MRDVRIGLFGIGLDTYWPQFAGLKERLQGYVQRVANRLARPGVAVVNLGLIDSPPKALEAGHRFRQEDVDLIFLHVTTYALSATVLPVVQRARVPVEDDSRPHDRHAHFRSHIGERTKFCFPRIDHVGKDQPLEMDQSSLRRFTSRPSIV